jgi:hypothetical protein
MPCFARFQGHSSNTLIKNNTHETSQTLSYHGTVPFNATMQRHYPPCFEGDGHKINDERKAATPNAPSPLHCLSPLQYSNSSAP